MVAIDTFGGSEPQAHAMQAQRVVGARAFESARGGTAFMKVVFGVRFDPPNRRSLGDECLVMRSPKTDSGACRNRLRHTS